MSRATVTAKYLPLLIVLLISAFLRFYKLGTIPHGFTWDEAAIGYNGYSVITTGYDEWLSYYPLSFRSFGDYKAPAAIYLVGVFTHFFGLSPFTVRFPFALSGVISVFLFYQCIQVLFEQKKYSNWLAITGAALLAFSPWHIHFTRTAFESGLSLTFLLGGSLTLLSGLQKESSFRHSYLESVVTALFLALALFSYHSAKITEPLLLLAIFFLFAKKQAETWKKITLLLLFLTLAILPLGLDTFFGSGAARSSVLVFSQHLDMFQTLTILWQHWREYFSASFLIWGGTETLRHSTGRWGILSIPTALFGLVGFLQFVSKVVTRKGLESYKVAAFATCFIVAGLLPAVISEGSLQQNRALLALPGFLILALCGIEFVLSALEASKIEKVTQNLILRSCIGVTICAYLFLFLSYWQYYLHDFAAASADAYQDGYVAVFNLTTQYEKGLQGFPQVDRILFSSEYGQPYIFALFVKKTHPLWYQGGSLAKYQFTATLSESDLSRPNTLVVATKSNLLPLEKARQIIYGSDGSIRFAVYLSQ